MFTAWQKHLLYTELARFAKAGFGLDKACEAILEQRAPRPHHEFCRGILKGLKAGHSIADSVKHLQLPVTDLEIRIIDAAEKGGALEVGFQHLGEYFRLINETRWRMLRGIIYPAFIIHMPLLVGIPLFLVMRNITGAEGVAGPRTFIIHVLWVLGGIYLLTILTGTAYVLLSKSGRRHSPADRILRTVPIIGKARRSLALSRFCKVFQLYLLSGQRMSEAVIASGEASQSGLVLESTRKITSAVKAGDLLGPGLTAAPAAFPRDFSRAITNAEMSGQLDDEFDRWARFYAEASADQMEVLAKALPRIIYILALLVGGYLVVQMVWDVYFGPITRMLESM